MSYKSNDNKMLKEKVTINIIKKTSLLSFLSYIESNINDVSFKNQLINIVIDYYKFCQKK